MSIHIGTRGSLLALAQVKLVTDYLEANDVSYNIKTYKTTGDQITDKPLYNIGGKALFSKELERALLNEEVDLVVHSLKDLETPRPTGLKLCAFLPRADARDVLVTSYDPIKNIVFGCQLKDLPQGAAVGTSSPRREAQALYHRPDLHMQNLRGNVQTRLLKLKQPFDAIFLAKAGLNRLGIQVHDDAIQPINLIVPAAGQGIIALECRVDDLKTAALVQGINDESAARAAKIERDYVETLNANCRSAVGIYADIASQTTHIFLDAELGGGKPIYRVENLDN